MSTAKKTDRAFIPQNDIGNYTLVIFPDRKIDELIAEELNTLAKLVPHSAIAARPLIPLAHFMAKERMEPTLIRWIQNVCNLQAAFPLTLNNYSCVPAQRSIHLRILETVPIQKICTSLQMVDGFIQQNDCPPMQIMKPLLQITGCLPESIYTAAIQDFAQKSFHETCIIDRIYLIRGSISEGSSVINTFTLPSTPC